MLSGVVFIRQSYHLFFTSNMIFATAFGGWFFCPFFVPALREVVFLRCFPPTAEQEGGTASPFSFFIGSGFFPVLFVGVPAVFTFAVLVWFVFFDFSFGLFLRFFVGGFLLFFVGCFRTVSRPFQSYKTPV